VVGFRVSHCQAMRFSMHYKHPCTIPALRVTGTDSVP